MKRWLVLLCLPFLISAEPVTPLPVSKAPLIIQPYYMKDIYRNQILDAVPFHVTVLTFRNFDNDRWRESKTYAISQSYKHQVASGKRQVIMLGERQENIEGRYIGVFREKDCACYLFDGNVISDNDHPIRTAISLLQAKRLYMLSDGSELATRIEAGLRRVLVDTKVKIVVAKVSSAAELRAQLVDWNSEARGILYINAYDLISDTGKRIRYRYIEQVVTDFNKVHLEIGVYRDAHRSALAIGLDPDDIGRSIIGTVRGTPMRSIEVKSSVNVARLNQLGLLHMAAGSFKEAFLYEPIDSR